MKRRTIMPEKKLADRLREAIRLRGYSIRTEKAYLHWYERFVRFHKLRHPTTMGAPEIEAFLTHLAVKEQALPPPRIRPSPPSSSFTKRSLASPSVMSTSCAQKGAPTSSPTSAMMNAYASSPSLTAHLTSSPTSSTVAAYG